MIASYSKNFIFLKTRKTAGTSVEAVLSSWCSGKDVVTPFSAADEPFRQQLGGKPMNYKSWFGRKYRNHATATEVKRANPELWNSAFKFTIERHPYERVVSRAYWWMHKYNRTDFDQEISRILETPKWVSNSDIYCIDGKVAVDEVIIFDTLWPRLAEIAGTRWGCTLPDTLPRAKGSYRTDRRPAREILSERQKERIYEIERQTFDRFGFAQ